jgi:hypothetical protein
MTNTETRLLFDRLLDPDRSALERLLTAAGLHEYLTQLMPSLAKEAREQEGHSWADVGEVLHITRQAAYQRLGKEPMTYFDGRGGYQVVDPSSSAYFESLRDARDQLRESGDRPDDLRLLEQYLSAHEPSAS